MIHIRSSSSKGLVHTLVYEHILAHVHNCICAYTCRNAVKPHLYQALNLDWNPE